MCDRSASFNLAVLLACSICGLLTADGVEDVSVNATDAADGQPSTLSNDPRCSPSVSVVLSLQNGVDSTTSRPLENNGSFVYDGVDYPADLRWTDGNFTYGCICILRNCIRKCCSNDEVLREKSNEEEICQKMPQKTPDLRLSKDQMTEEIQHIDKLRKRFFLVQGNACPSVSYTLNPDEFVLQANGSFVDADGLIVSFWNYCIDWKVTVNRIGILVCWTPEMESVSSDEKESVAHHKHVGLLVSIPFLVATFLVYAITPELRNLYGKTLMCYVICLIIAYVFLISANYIHMSPIRALCVSTAYIMNFSFLASFFWLNVMCFDIWWTFGGFRSLQGSVNQRERKKFMMYSIYAWGCASLLSIICAIMDSVPSVPKEWIRPEIGINKCWFSTDKAIALYFYGPMGLTVLCNIFLFISTALKIMRHNQNTAHHLRGSESRRHDDNKQWFNLYLKLFIVMGINWSMEIISWLFKTEPEYLWYVSDLTNALQGLIIFIIFVWKEKIKRLLLKRFGCQDRGFFSSNSTRSGCHSTASRTCTTTSGISLQEKTNPYVQTNCRAKSSSDEADP